MIELKNVTKTYRAKKGRPFVALKGVDLTLPDKGMVFLLGRSGSGKTTLLNIIGLLDAPTSGTVKIGGSEPQGKEIDDYRNRFSGFVFQDFALLEEETVGRNVALALQLQSLKDTGERVAQALGKVGLAGYEERFPYELSGGEKQRVAIARAIVKDSEMILADEPTGNLDSETGEEIFEILRSLAREKLVVVVSHDREFAEKYADRIVELKDGAIISDSGEQAAEENRKKEGGVKSHLPTALAFRMGWRNIGKKKFKSAMTFLVATLAMAALVFAQALVSFNGERAVAKSVVKNGLVSITLVQRDAPDKFAGLIGGSDDFRDEDFEEALKDIPHFLRYDVVSESRYSDVYIVESKEQFEKSGFSLYDGALELTDDTVYLGDSEIELMFRDTYEAQQYSFYDFNYFVREGEELVPLSAETYDYTSLIGKTIAEKSKNYSGEAVYTDFFTVAGVVRTGHERFAGMVDGRYTDYSWEQYLERFGETEGAYRNEQEYELRPDYWGKYLSWTCFATREYVDRHVDYFGFSDTETDPHTIMLGGSLRCDGLSFYPARNFSERDRVLMEGKDVLPAPSEISLEKGEIILDEASYNRLFRDDGLSIATTISGNRVIRQPKRLGSLLHILVKRGDKTVLDGEYKLVGVMMDEQYEWTQKRISGTVYLGDEDMQAAAAVSLRPDKTLVITDGVGEMSLYRALRTLRYDHAIAAEFDFSHSIYTIEPYQKNIGFAFLAIGAIMVLVTLLIVVSLISYNILAQQKEIGILRAIGARAGDIAKIYFAEAAILALTVFVLSMAITLTLISVLNGIFAAAEQYGLVLFGYTPLTFPVLILGSFGLIFAGTALPLRKISRYKPAEAIKKG